jgi:hypothetical protein
MTASGLALNVSRDPGHERAGTVRRPVLPCVTGNSLQDQDNSTIAGSGWGKKLNQLFREPFYNSELSLSAY